MVKSRGIVGLTAPLIGRDDELDNLRTAFKKTLGGDGQLITLSGEAGIGKSRLVSELRLVVSSLAEPERELNALYLEGRCMEMRQSTPYWPFVDILYTYFGWTPQSVDTERAQRVCNTLDELTDLALIAQEDAAQLAQAFGVLLSLHYGNEWDDGLRNATPEQIRFQIFQAITTFVTALAYRQPLVLVLEDLHWADPLSLDLTGQLMENIAGRSILLLCVYRPEAALRQDRLAFLARRRCPDSLTEIRLHELTPDHSRTLAETLLSVENLTPPSKQRILDASQGNPFFLEEIIHSLVDADLIYREGTVWRARQEMTTAIVPTRVQSVILSRVDRLEPAAKETLQVASVCGRLFQPQIVAAVVGDDERTMATLDVLLERAFVYHEQTVPYEVCSFRHVLAQQAVYKTIPGRQRAQLHGRIGAALETLYADDVGEIVDELAYHFDRSDVVEKAIVYLNRAGVRARNAYMADEAIGYFQRSIERMDELSPDQLQPEWRYVALAELGKTYMRATQYPEADSALRQAIAWGKAHDINSTEVARLHWWLGDMLINWTDHHLEARQICLDGLAMLDDQESTEAALLLGVLAFTYEIEGEQDKFYETTDGLATFLDRVPYATGLRASYGAVQTAVSGRKDLVAWEKWLAFSMEQARIHHDDWTQAELLMDFAYKEFFMGGTFERAIAYMQESMSLCQQVGDAKRVNWAEISIGDLLLDWGQSQQAEGQLRQGLVAAYGVNGEHIYGVLLKLASSCLAQRKWSEAEQAGKLARDQAVQEHTSQAETFVLLGLTALGSGEREQAADYFVQAVEDLDDPDTLYTPRRRKWWLMINSYFASAVCGLELALDDDNSFREFCRDFRERHPKSENANFQQWYLEAADTCQQPETPALTDDFASQLSDDWTWLDPDDGCSYTTGDGLVVQAPIYRDLYQVMINAPRLMQPVAGDFVAQVLCEPDRDDRPGIGGLLLWVDKFNYLKLVIGIRSQNEVSLEGQIDGNDRVFGRGLLDASPVWLRLERTGEYVRALCSPDGEQWLLVGQVTFTAEESLQLGLHAIGHVDRTFYWAPHPDGTSIRFREFALWL